MKLHELFGYDRHGKISELDTALNKGKLNTKDVSFSALGFNAPAWVAASSMSILYSMSGHQAPLAILIAFFFPMLVLAVCMVSLRVMTADNVKAVLDGWASDLRQSYVATRK